MNLGTIEQGLIGNVNFQSGYLYTGQMRSQSSNSLSGDQLTIIELNPLKIVTSHQMIQTGVSDEGTVVQLQDCEVLTGTG